MTPAAAAGALMALAGGATSGRAHMAMAMHRLPAADQAIDSDASPFVETALGPNGEVVMFYDFDAQPAASAPVYTL